MGQGPKVGGHAGAGPRVLGSVAGMPLGPPSHGAETGEWEGPEMDQGQRDPEPDPVPASLSALGCLQSPPAPCSL